MEVHHRHRGRVPRNIYPSSWSLSIFMGVPLPPSSRHFRYSAVFPVELCGWTCPPLDEVDRWSDVWAHVVASGRHGHDHSNPEFIPGRAL